MTTERAYFICRLVRVLIVLALVYVVVHGCTAVLENARRDLQDARAEQVQPHLRLLGQAGAAEALT